MTAFIELHVKGGGAAIIEAGSIMGILTAKGAKVTDPGTEEKPVRVILRGGETIDVIGDWGGKILARVHQAKLDAKSRRAEAGGDPIWEFWVDWLTPLGDPSGTDDAD